MAQKGSPADRGRSLHSIKLKDFPENAGLADDFFDRESDTEATDETFVMTRGQIPEDDDGSDGFVVRSVSRLFDDADISAGNTTLISPVGLEDDNDLSGIGLSAEDRVLASGSVPSEYAASDQGADASGDEQMTPEPSKAARKRSVPMLDREQISRNQVKKKREAAAKPKKPVKVKDFGKRKHTAAYHVIKFCIFLLLWVAVAFASYQLYKFGYKVLNDQPMDSADASKIQVTVSGNETDEEMGEKLLGYGLIDDVGIYKWRCRLYSSEYNAGTYRLSRSYNTEKILNIFAGYNYSDGTEEESADESVEESVTEAGLADTQETVAADNAGGDENGDGGGEEYYGEDDNGEEDYAGDDYADEDGGEGDAGDDDE